MIPFAMCHSYIHDYNQQLLRRNNRSRDDSQSSSDRELPHKKPGQDKHVGTSSKMSAHMETSAGRLATANAAFSLDLYRELRRAAANRNLFFSPGSISVALGMTYLGARGNTAAEMRQTLKFKSVPDDELHSSFSDLLDVYSRTNDGIKLLMANRLFAEKSFQILGQYLADTKKSYKAELSQVSFVSDTEAARQEINKWVEDQTASRIKDLIPSGAIDTLTRLVLVNAVYFKGDWKQKFNPEKTEDADFNNIDGSKTKVPMMFQKKKFVYGANPSLGCQALELPYADGSMSLVIFLPEPGKFQHFEENVKLEDMVSCEKSFMMSEKDVSVWLPQFKMEESFTLNETLQKMGVKDLFDEVKVDLTGIDQANSIVVSKVLHKAFLEVNEEGSEAAAATAVVMMMRCLPKQFHFRADRPFMFIIRENSTRSVLFMGSLMNPSA